MARPEVREWILQARADEKTAADCLSAGDYYACAFFSQQCVEKWLKALYIERRKEMPPKSHNLLDLGLALGLPLKWLAVAREVTPEFVLSRYPDVAGAAPARLYDRATAARLLRLARSFSRWAARKQKG